MTGFVRWDTDHHRAELGYALNDEKWYGNGYMTEACRPIIDYGFEQLNIHRMEAYIETSNKASLKIVQKLQFTYEATLKQHYKTDDGFEDSELHVKFKTT